MADYTPQLQGWLFASEVDPEIAATRTCAMPFDFARYTTPCPPAVLPDTGRCSAARIPEDGVSVARDFGAGRWGINSLAGACRPPSRSSPSRGRWGATPLGSSGHGTALLSRTAG